MIGLQRYPFEHEPYAGTPKTIAFKHAAEQNGLEWFLPQLAVTFANEGRPPVPGEKIVEKIPQPARARPRHLPAVRRVRRRLQLRRQEHARLQLPHARQAPRRGDPHAGRRAHDRSRARAAATASATCRSTPEHGAAESNGRPVPLTQLTCDHLVLSAGTLGTTNLLLRNRSAFPRLSRKLGTRFCGNGDLLTLALNCAEMIDGQRTPRIIDPGYGPVITSRPRGCPTRSTAARAAASTCRTPATRSTWRGSCTCWPRRRRCGTGARTAAYLVKNWLKGSPDTDVTGHIADLLEVGRAVRRRPAAARHGPRRPGRADVPAATGGSTSTGSARSPTPTSSGCARRVAQMAHSLGGKFADNPIWFLKRVITVHPLGGAPMGRQSGEGVVDPYGNVFGYPGLHIADGSVMPGPPARTRASRSPRWPTASPTACSSPPPPRRRPPHDRDRHRSPASVQFTEEMLGHVTFGETDYNRGANADRPGAGFLKFHLTIVVDDIERFGTATRGARRARSAGSRATPSAAGCRSSAACSTCSSTPSRASSTCSTGCSSATASATR